MSAEGKDKVKSSSGLVPLAVRYFRKEGYKVEQSETMLEGFSGLSRKFDLIDRKSVV